jgi:hypothetical protein
MKINQKVLVDGNAVLTGQVVGFGHQVNTRTNDVRPVVLVMLDKGFYSPDESVFVSVMCVHPDNIRTVD